MKYLNGSAYDIELVPLFANKEGLPKVYNNTINQHQDADIIVFIHDDIILNDIMLFDKLLAAKDAGLDIVGVAGAKGYEVPDINQPTGWWSPPNAKFGFAGQVCHYDAEKGCYFTTSYGPCPQRVLVIDGCFIAIMRSALDKGLKFNEKFNFDFYDIALCMDAYKQGLKVGVSPIMLTHNSVGRGFLKPSFLEAQKLFVSEYFS